MDINIPGALRYSAEELYEILFQKKEQERKEGKENKKFIGDDHSKWEETAKKKYESHSEEKKESIEKEFIDERKEFYENRQKRIQKAKESYERMKREVVKNYTFSSSKQILLGSVGDAEEELAWEFLLQREIEKEEFIWSQRRSIKENNYAYRLESNEEENNAETEVMIDISGSVNIELVKAFLRIIKPILKHSKLKVGCFNEKFWGMVEIKTFGDIEHFVLPEGARDSSAWTEDWDLAVRSFSKRKEVNKIVLTDGNPCPGVMPKDDLKNEKVLWLVYGNKNFKPCCGKVIFISERQLTKMNAENSFKL